MMNTFQNANQTHGWSASFHNFMWKQLLRKTIKEHKEVWDLAMTNKTETSSSALQVNKPHS